MARTLLRKSPNLAQVLVSKKDLKYLSGSKSEKIKFDLDVFQDLDHTDKGKLEKDITSFVEKNHLTTQKIILVVTPDVYFEKEFPFFSGNEIEANKFTQMVPLSSKAIHEYPLNSHSVLVVTNKSFIQGLKNIFETAKCSVISVVPQIFYDQNKSSLKILKANSLLPQPIFKRFEPTLKVKVGINRISALIGVFILLVAIFIAILPTGKTPIQKTPVSQSTSASSVTTPTPTITTIGNATVKITYLNKAMGVKADQLKNLLLKAGFVNVTTEQSTIAGASNTKIVFNINFPADLKDKVVYNANKIFNDTSIQDTNNNETNVTVIIGKNN